MSLSGHEEIRNYSMDAQPQACACKKQDKCLLKFSVYTAAIGIRSLQLVFRIKL